VYYDIETTERERETERFNDVDFVSVCMEESKRERKKEGKIERERVRERDSSRWKPLPQTPLYFAWLTHIRSKSPCATDHNVVRDHRPGKWSVAGQGGYIYIYIYIYKSKHYTMVGKGAARIGV